MPLRRTTLGAAPALPSSPGTGDSSSGALPARTVLIYTEGVAK